LRLTVKACKLSTVFFNQCNQVKDLINMELSSVNSTKLQAVDQKLTEKKIDDTTTPNHGGGGIHIPDKKSDSVTLSEEAIAASKEEVTAASKEEVTAYHGGGGIHIPD
jgi:hypothetical protein